jgi:Bacterial DNA polymerase III alpha subunit finger domain
MTPIWRRSVCAGLTVCSSPSLGSAAILAGHGGVDSETAGAAWRLLEAGDTLCIPQVESLGMRQLFRRARELRDQHGDGSVLERLEDLAQLLALWRPGAWGKEREQAYLERRSQESDRITCIPRCPGFWPARTANAAGQRWGYLLT